MSRPMSGCAECEENLNRTPVIPEPFRSLASEYDRQETMRQMHERSEREGISHTEAGARMFVEAFPAASLP